MKLQRGVTLIEVLIVTIILAVLLAVVWLTVAPRAKASSQETVAANDLKQFVVGLHLYMADYDGELPMWPKNLPKSVPTRISNFKFFEGNPLYYYVQGYGDIVLTRNYAAVKAERLLTNPMYPWDEQKYPIAITSIQKLVGNSAHHQIPYYSSCGIFERYVSVKRVDTLSTFMDGHVSWKPIPGYVYEIADCTSQVIKEIMP